MELFDVQTTPPPAFERTVAEQIAQQQFGITAKAQALPSERDQNFRLSTAEGCRYVMRIANAAESAGITLFQSRALLHVGRVAPALPLPRLRCTGDGKPGYTLADAEGRQHAVRVLTWVDGQPLGSVERARWPLASLGEMLARLGRALSGFFDANAGHAQLWDMQNAPRLQPLAEHLDDAVLREQVMTVLAHYEQNVVPQLGNLRSQIIHNDLNPDNVLVANENDTRIGGIIDFGDMVHAPLIQDVAVAAAYLLGGDSDPCAPLLPFLRAYQSVTPLDPQELDLILDLVETRLATTVLISNWRAARYPDNSEYVLRSNAAARRQLARLAPVPRTSLRERLVQ